VNALDDNTLNLCEAGPPGDNPPMTERAHRREAAMRLHGWLQQNGHLYANAAAAKADACQFVLETVILGAILTAIIEWVVERVLNRWFGD
jgi:hypothetical protein